MIKAVIFDCDGVVVQSKKFSESLQKKYGISQQMTSEFFENEFQKALIGKEDIKKALVPYIKNWGWSKSVEQFLDIWFNTENKISQEIVKAINVLTKKGIKSYLATNQERHRTSFLINKMNFGKIFDKIFSSAYLGYMKPSQIFFKKMFKEIEHEQKVKKNEILFWDDQQKNVDAAKQFGFKAELYKNITHFENKIAEYLSK